MAEVDGKALLDRVCTALAPQVDGVIVCGRDWPGLTRVNDLPIAGLGPLGGLAGALAYAEANGFDAVLSVGCDHLDLPTDLAKRLMPAPAHADSQPIVGMWSAGLAGALYRWLDTTDDRALYRWARHCGSHAVRIEGLTNINRREDLPRGSPHNPQ